MRRLQVRESDVNGDKRIKAGSGLVVALQCFGNDRVRRRGLATFGAMKWPEKGLRLFFVCLLEAFIRLADRLWLGQIR